VQRQRTGELIRLGDGPSLEVLKRSILARRPGRTWEDLITGPGLDPEQVRSAIREGLKQNYRALSGIENWAMTLTAYKPKTPAESAAAEVIRQRVQSWPKGREGSIVLWGEDNGPGKTHLGVAYAIAVLDLPRPYSVRWWRAADLFHGLELGRFDEESPVMEETRQCRLLVLDDLDKLNLSGNRQQWGLETLYRIVDARDHRDLATCVTTQLPREGRGSLREMFGRAITDRLPAHWWTRVAGPSGRAKT